MKKVISACFLVIGLCASTLVSAAAAPISNPSSASASVVAIEPPVALDMAPKMDPPIPTQPPADSIA